MAEEKSSRERRRGFMPPIPPLNFTPVRDEASFRAERIINHARDLHKRWKVGPQEALNEAEMFEVATEQLKAQVLEGGSGG